MLYKFKLRLLKFIFSELEIKLIFSSLYQTEDKYRDKYNDISNDQHYHNKTTDKNIKILTNLRDMFNKSISLK